MSRNASGVYSLPEPPFTPGSTISSTAVNSDFSDVADALTDSLSRTGLGEMQAVLSLATAGLTYAADPDTGLRRTTANTQALSVGGSDYTFTASDVTTPAGTSLLPLIGEIRMWALATAPSGWVFLRGQACTTDYPLWRAALIADGNKYGTSGGDPLFPNMQCALPAGFDATGRGLLTGSTTLGAFLGEQSRTLITGNLPAYTPSGANSASVVTISGAPSGVWRVEAGGTQINGAGSGMQIATLTATAAAQTFTGNAQGGTSAAFGIVQPTIILNFIGRAA
jgi:microcystin-dependent protein